MSAVPVCHLLPVVRMMLLLVIQTHVPCAFTASSSTIPTSDSSWQPCTGARHTYTHVVFLPDLLVSTSTLHVVRVVLLLVMAGGVFLRRLHHKQ